MPVSTIGRFGLQQQLIQFLNATGLAYATTPMDKAQISETQPGFLGSYAGAPSSDGVQSAVEGADLVLNLGGKNAVFHNQTLWGSIGWAAATSPRRHRLPSWTCATRTHRLIPHCRQLRSPPPQRMLTAAASSPERFLHMDGPACRLSPRLRRSGPDPISPR